MAAVRPSAVVALAALVLAIWVIPAAGSVTVGQVSPGVPTSCSSSFEFLESSSADYTMPAAGTITSWTHRAQTNLNQTPTLKIYRKTGDPATYQVVAHDGPNAIGSNATETFPTSIPVKAGDVLGVTGAGGANIGCSFTGPGELFSRMSNLADGDFGDFSLLGANRRVNVSAVLNPTDTFTVGKTARNKKKGTATLNLTFPNPGELGVSAGGAKVSAGGVIAKSVLAGPAQVLVKATGRKRKKLNSSGKVNISVALAYTPTGGDVSSQSLSVKLKKKTK
jgi:hypothetical protein